MKKILFFLVCIIIVFAFIMSCQKERFPINYNAKFRIDSLKQDSVFFAHQYYLKGPVRVFYTVINNGDVILNSYRYTINAMSCDSTYYQIPESHYNTVPSNSERHDSTKIGIGNSRVAYARIDNISFQ